MSNDILEAMVEIGRERDALRTRVAELEREVKFREAQTQRMMLARDAMERERDEARERVLVMSDAWKAAMDNVARLREALKWSLDELDATPFDPDEHSQDAVTARWRATEKARAALASAPSAEPEGPDYSGLCSAPECGGHCGFAHAVGCEAIREYLADHGGDPYKAPSRAEPTPRDMRVAEAVREAYARAIIVHGRLVAGAIDLAAVVAKAVTP